MKTKKLIDFLSRFDPNSRVGLLILDREKHMVFTVEELLTMTTDPNGPILVMTIQTGETYEEIRL